MNFDRFNRKEYNGKAYDLTECIGEWNGYEVYLGYLNGEEDVLLAKNNKAWYASEDDLKTINYLFDL